MQSMEPRISSLNNNNGGKNTNTSLYLYVAVWAFCHKTPGSDDFADKLTSEHATSPHPLHTTEQNHLQLTNLFQLTPLNGFECLEGVSFKHFGENRRVRYHLTRNLSLSLEMLNQCDMLTAATDQLCGGMAVPTEADNLVTVSTEVWSGLSNGSLFYPSVLAMLTCK